MRLKHLAAVAALVAFTAPALAKDLNPPIAYRANPNDFGWLRKDFNPSNFSWMTGKGAGLKPPGMPLTLGTAPFPKGWALTPHKKGGYTLSPPNKNKSGKGSGGGKGGGKKGR